MANTTPTPYMSLALPIPTVETGPQYAIDLNAAFTTVDSHTHVPGQGVQVPTAGLNINADLPCNGFSVKGAATLQLKNGTGSTALAALYVSGGDLYYNNAAGSPIPITIGTTLNIGSSGSISGMSGGAAVAYASINQTYSFFQASSTPANMSVASLLLAQPTASPKTVTLSTNATQPSNYTLTLPSALPSATSFLTLDASGNMASAYTVDNSSVYISSNQIAIKPGGVTKPMQAPLGQQTNTLTGFYQNTTTTLSDVASVTITTTGRPVMLMVTNNQVNPTGGANSGYFKLFAGNLSNVSTMQANVVIVRDSTTIVFGQLVGFRVGTMTGATATGNYFGGTGNNVVTVPVTATTVPAYMEFPLSFLAFDVPSAGSHTYTFQAAVAGGSGATTVVEIAFPTLLAYEL